MFITMLRMVAVLVAAGLLGNWFLKELKTARLLGKPWYAPYLSLPGLLIIVLIIVLPVLVKVLR